MPNMDPSMLRNSAGMMKGMNEHQFSQMKDQVQFFLNFQKRKQIV